MEVTQVSIHREMDKEYVAYIDNGILLSYKKEWGLATCDNMDGHRVYYVKWNKSEKEKRHMISTYMWNIKKQNKWKNKQKPDS